MGDSGVNRSRDYRKFGSGQPKNQYRGIDVIIALNLKEKLVRRRSRDRRGNPIIGQIVRGSVECRFAQLVGPGTHPRLASKAIHYENHPTRRDCDISANQQSPSRNEREGDAQPDQPNSSGCHRSV